MSCDIYGRFQSPTKHGQWLDRGCIRLGQSYIMFAALANVRNYEGILPIAMPRGLPVDFYPRSIDRARPLIRGTRCFMGEHSFSWLTLFETIEWDGWNQQFEMTREYGREPYRVQLKDYEKRSYNYLFGKYVRFGPQARMVFGFSG